MSKNPHNQKRQAKPRSGQARFPDIVAQARDLGVSRTHLYLVLTGARQSRRLMAAYLRYTKAAA